MQDLKLRRAGPGDLAAVDRLLSESYPALLKADYPPSTLVTALPLISRAQPALLASGTYFLALMSAQVVGAGGWTANAPGGAAAGHSVGHIRHVVTDHRAVRKGIGRTLLRHVINDARAAGITTLRCQSTLTAEPFYASLGFRALQQIEVPLRPGITLQAVAMEMALSSE